MNGASRRSRVERLARALAALGLLAPSATACQEAPPARVRILYDEHRIPHVLAATDEGAFFGLGYQQARDFPVATLASLWSATGRFATVAGAAVLERDRRILTFGIDRTARAQERDLAANDPRLHAWLTSFAAGVEAGRRWWLAHPEALAALAGEDGRAIHVDPVPAWLDPWFARDALDARLRRLFEEPITLFHVLSLGVAMNGGPEFIGAGYALTNVWAVRNDAERGTSSLTVDSHQPIKRGGARAYLVQVSGDAYDVAGYTMPGFPCVVLGFNERLAFANTTLPQAPRRIQEAGDVPFRFRGAAPVVRAAWEAELLPDTPPRIRVGDEEVELLERTVALEAWDVERGELVADPRGPFTCYRVPATAPELAAAGLEHPVLAPAPGEPLDVRETEPTRIRFEGRSFLAAPSPFAFWIGVGLAQHVGAGENGLQSVFERALLCFGRGQAFQAVDADGGLEFLWSSLVPVPGAGALAVAPWRSHDAPALDGGDPAQRWQGMHAAEELPHLVDRAGYGERAELWLNANDSPHALRRAGFDGAPFEGRDYLLEPEPWRSLRHDRARALLEAAAEDGRVSAAELERAALDVQDPWAVRSWPLVAALAPELSESARAFLAWIDARRLEAADGGLGDEPFLAHAMSQVTVFTSLLHHGFEARLLALEAPASHELALAFDALTPVPAPRAFLAEERWARVRAALQAALEEVAAWHAATLAGAGVATRATLLEHVDALAQHGPWSRERWNALLDDEAPSGVPWAGERVPVRWGQVHLYTLTPHARRAFPPRLAERALRTILAPQDEEASFHAAMRPVLFPAAGTGDSIFQHQAEGFRDTRTALHAIAEDGAERLMLLPVDFGSQLLWSVELDPEGPPRARFLAALGSTEITRELPANGVRAGDHARTAERFAAGQWSDFELDPEVLERGASRVLVLERDANGAWRVGEGGR